MRVFSNDDGYEDFWPAYTDILMVTVLILTLLVVTFSITRNDDSIKQEQERRKAIFATRFHAVLKTEEAKDLVRLSSPPGERQIITFSDQLLFDKGDAELRRKEGQASLAKLSQVLQKFTTSPMLLQAVRVNGHTDEDPIETPQFPSNWHLSSARATTVVYFFTKHGLRPEHLSSAGFAEYRPYDAFGNRLKDKAKKRRIDIELLYPEDWLTSQKRYPG